MSCEDADAGRSPGTSPGKNTARGRRPLAPQLSVARSCSIPAGLTWQPSLGLEATVDEWLNSMSAEMQIKFVGALRRTEALLPAQGFSKWSLFAGTGSSTRVTQALTSVLLNKYNMVFSFHDSLYCEIAPAKQKIILQQHDPKVLVQDVSLLDADSAPVPLSA